VPHEIEMVAYLKREGVPLEAVTRVAPSFNAADLLQGRVDAMSGYQTDEPFDLRAAAFRFNQMSPRAGGIDFYGDTLFATDALLQKRPQLVKAFRAASLAGWRYAMDHPEEIADLIRARYSQRKSRAHLLYEAEEMRRLMQPDLVEIGHMSPGRWQHIADVYAELGLMPAKADLVGLIYDERSKQLPPWFVPALAGTLAAFVVVGAFALRLLIVTRRLDAEIKQRQATDERLAATQNDMATLIDATPGAAMLLAPDGDILAMNATGAGRFKRDKQSIVGENIFTLSTPDIAPARRQAVAQVAAERRTHVIEDVSDGMNLRNTIVPVFDRDGEVRRVAVFSEDITESRRYEDSLRAANKQLTQQIEEIQRLQAALQEQAVRDSLTGLFNRRYLDETLEREIARAKREGHPLALAMLDVDHFKRLNDTYGHPAGDQVLAALGTLLREDTRAEDVPCRYGGEEFLVLMPHISLESAQERAEQWRRRFAELVIRHGELSLQTTISVGVAAYPQHGHAANELTQCADLALYLAKHDGRNRVVVFEVTPLTIDI